jgi:carbamoyltransferase
MGQRVQTVAQRDDALCRELMTAFATLSGVPVGIHASFNPRGKPIVGTPRDALERSFTSPLDVLAIGPRVVEKAA